MSYYIYQITGAGMTYYGSSKNVENRRYQHIHGFKYYKQNHTAEYTSSYCASYKIFDATDDWIMEIIEDGIETKFEARIIEDEYINNNECVNINNALRLVGEELKEYKTKWNRHNRLRLGLQPLIPISNQSEEITKEKRRLINQKYREDEKHREELNQKCKDWRANHIKTEVELQTDRDKSKAYRLANLDKVKASKKAAYDTKKNDPEFIAKQKAYYQANKEEKAAKQKAHHDANKDEINAHRKALRDAKKLGDKL
jgi:hypothetical protein